MLVAYGYQIWRGCCILSWNHVTLPSPAPGPVGSSGSSSDHKAQRHESECPSEFPLSAQSRPSSLWSGQDAENTQKSKVEAWLK